MVTERTTSTNVECDTPVAIDEASTCTVTVTDTDAGTASDPSGSVDFTSSNLGGDFDFGNCILVGNLDGTSSCSVEYTGDTAGTDTITATYHEAASTIHESSFDTDDILVTERTTSTNVECDTPVAIDEASTCAVTVTDTDAGTASDPSGSVDFTSSNLGGDFDFGSCILVGNLDGTSSCSVEYTGDTAGTDTITATYPEAASTIHKSSFDSDDIVVTERTTSTNVECDTPVAIDEASTCAVTVTDTDAGTASDPSGSVDFTSSNLGGDFDFGSCILVGNLDGTSSCSVEYTGDTAGTDTITATYTKPPRPSSSRAATATTSWSPNGPPPPMSNATPR